MVERCISLHAIPFPNYKEKRNICDIVKYLNANGGTTETFMKICDMNSQNAIEQNEKRQKLLSIQYEEQF